MLTPRHFLLTAALAATGCLLQAQNIGINTTGASPHASAMLDVVSNNRGLLVPRMTAAQRIAIAAPATGLLVFQTNASAPIPANQFWYYDGTDWKPLFSDRVGWSIWGNAGTNAGTNFIGTTDAQHFVMKTGGSAAINERMRVLSTGPVVVNRTTATTGDVFSVYATGASGAIGSLGVNAISGYTGTGWGVTGSASGTTGTTFGLYGRSTATTGTANGVRGEAASTTATGVYGLATNTAIAGTANGVYGEARAGIGTGLFGIATYTSNGTVQPVGTYGRATNRTGFGMYGRNNNVAGTGISATGNNAGGMYLVNGSGLAATGTETGAFHYFTSPGVGQGTLIQDAYGAQWNVGYYNGISYYKIVGNGLVSTIVKDLEEQPVLLYCPEAPEVLFQDYGTGQLSNGSAHIDLDPVLTKNIIVSDEHPMKVFIQVEGDCNGVYVTNKSATGFDVHELGGGISNVPFSWSITATRGDEALQNENGDIRHASYRQRFGPAPPHQERREMLDHQPVP